MGNTKNIAFWIILFLLMVALFNVFSNGSRTSMGREISYSDFLNRVEAGQVAAVSVGVPLRRQPPVRGLDQFHVRIR